MTSSKSLMWRSGLDEALINMQYLEIEFDKVELSPLREYATGGSCILRIGTYTSPDSQREEYVRINVGVKVFKIGYTEEDRIKMAMGFVKELEVWATLKHENLLPLCGYYVARDLSEAWLISEWQHNGNIREYTCERESSLRFQLLGDVLKALEYLHSMRPAIVHRDIKPGNILVGGNPQRAMLCDFGLCKSSGLGSAVLTRRASTEALEAFDSEILSDVTSCDHIFTSQSDELKGTFRYMAPELLQQTPPPYSKASDMWAWACTAHEVISGEAPYGWYTNETKVLRAINEGRLPSKKIYSEGFWEFVRQLSYCWGKNPRDRPSAKECHEELYAGDSIQTLIGIMGARLRLEDIDHNQIHPSNNIKVPEWLQEGAQTIRISSITAPVGGEWSVRIAQPQVRESKLVGKWVFEPLYDVPYTKLPTFLQLYINHHAHRFRHENLDWIAWSLHGPPKFQFIALYGSKNGPSPCLEWSTLPRLDVLLSSVRRASLIHNLMGFRFTSNGGTLTLGSSWLPKVEEPYIALSFPVSFVPPVEDPEKADANDEFSKALLEKLAELRRLFTNGIPPPTLYHFCAAYFILEVPGALRRLQDCAQQAFWTDPFHFRSQVEIDPAVEGLLCGRDSSAWNDTELMDKLRKLIGDMVPIIRRMMIPYLEEALGFLPVLLY